LVDILLSGIQYNNNETTCNIQGGEFSMTEQEAIKILMHNYPPIEEESLRKAFDLAINALRTVNTLMDTGIPSVGAGN
jgi:hypothetical protein